MQNMKTIQDLIKDRTEIYSLPQEATVRAAAQYLLEKHIRAVPVTDQAGRLASIFSEWDVVQAIAKNLDVDQRSIAYTATRHPITVTPDQNYAECLTMMLKNGFHHLVVVKQENGTEQILGTISLNDLLRLDHSEKGEPLESYKTFLSAYQEMLNGRH
jgi:CBS domain-containing protein